MSFPFCQENSYLPKLLPYVDFLVPNLDELAPHLPLAHPTLWPFCISGFQFFLEEKEITHIG